MSNFLKVNSTEELLEHSAQQQLIAFGNLLPDIFSIVDVSSNIVFMNQPALEAVKLKLDDVIGSQYTCFKTNIVELAEAFLSKDKAIFSKANPNPVISASWSQLGNNNEWFFLMGKRKPIYGIDGNIIGISSYFSTMHDALLPQIMKFFADKKLSYFHGLKQPFDFEVVNSDDKFNLSSRETEVLFCMLYGRTGKEIAEILKLSARTVEAYVESMKNKMDVETKSQIIEKGIISGYLGAFPQVLFEKVCGRKL